MKRILILLIFTISFLLAACSWAGTPAATETRTITATPDLCAPENLPAEVAKVNKLMREFDDYSSLASNTPQSQLVILIPEMQRILRDAEDQAVPACLTNLKKMQLAHMNIVVQTLMAFMNSTDVNVVNAGIAQARQLHAQYDIEMASLLGTTLVAPPSPTPGAATPEANSTPAPTAIVQPAALVINPGPNSVNMRSAPSLDAPGSGALEAQASATAIGKSADEQWIQVEIPGQPGQTAWVFASLVQLSVPIAQLPVVTP
jgi:hypothetical protein